MKYGGSRRPVRQQLYVRKLSNGASKDLLVKLLSELNWKGKDKDNSAMCKQLSCPLEIESGFHQYRCSAEKFLASRPSQYNSPENCLPAIRTMQQSVRSPWQDNPETACSQRYANWKEHLWHCMREREWYIPAGVPEGQKTRPEKKPHSTHWLLHLQPVWVESNIETLSMLLHRFSYVIHHDYKAVGRLFLLLVVCLSSLKCDSGVMNNCTAIKHTVILLFQQCALLLQSQTCANQHLSLPKS